MKGKRSFKRILAVLMAVVFTVSGITYSPKTVSAATWTADPNHTGYIYWYGANGEAGWGMATWGGGGWNYSYDYSHDGTNSLFAAQNESSDNQTIQLGSPKKSYDARTEYYYRYVIHSDTAFSSVAFMEGYYADWGETGLGTISFNAGDTVISGTKTTGSTVNSISVGLKIANVPKGTTISIDEYYFEKTPYSATTVEATTAEPTTAAPQGNIIAGKTWTGWFEPEGWASYSIGTSGAAEDGYTLTNKGIGSNWYSIQTGIDGVSFSANTSYTCYFQFTTSAPKSLVIDNRSSDATIFTETAASSSRGWINNGDGTYTYTYIGTYNSSSASNLNVRVSLGYNASKTSNVIGDTDGNLGNFAANGTITATLSNFIITPSSEFVEPTVEVTTAAPTPADVTAVTASSSAANTLTATWTESASAITGQQYEVYLDNAATPTTTVNTGVTSYTFTGVTAGSHTVTVKAKYGSTYASAAGVTSSSVTVNDPTPVDAASGSVSASAANTISATWVEGTDIPSGQKYGLFVDGSATPSGSLISSVGDGETISNQTISGLTAGSHTVVVKATLDNGTNWSTGTSLGTVTVYNATPGAPASVTAVDSATQGEAIDVTFTAASPTATQTYRIYIDGDVVDTVSSAGTYTYSATVDVAHTVQVCGYDANASTTESAKVPATAISVTPTWHKTAKNDTDGWSTIGIAQLTNYNNTTSMDYKGTSLANLQIRKNSAKSGEATNYGLRMRIPNSSLYDGLVDGVEYTMTFSFNSTGAGSVWFNTENYGSASTPEVVSGANSIEKTFTNRTASNTSTNYLVINLTDLPAGTILSNFDVSFAVSDVPVPNPTAVSATSSNNDEITVSWTEGSGVLTGTLYDIYLDNTLVASNLASSNASGYTMSNLSSSYRGTGHTVKVVPKYTLAGTTYDNTGTTSSSFEIKGPIDIDSISYSTSSTEINVWWNDPANVCSGQTYNVYLDDVLQTATPISAPTSGSPYTITGLTDNTQYTVTVKAYYNSEETSTGVSNAITTSSEVAPDVSSLSPTNAEAGWTFIATTSNGDSWYYCTEDHAALTSATSFVTLATPSSSNYSSDSTVSTAALIKSFGTEGRYATSVWFTPTSADSSDAVKLSDGNHSSVYFQSTTNADILDIAQSLFGYGVSYITLRDSSDNDVTVRIKKVAEQNPDLTDAVADVAAGTSSNWTDDTYENGVHNKHNYWNPDYSAHYYAFKSGSDYFYDENTSRYEQLLNGSYYGYYDLPSNFYYGTKYDVYDGETITGQTTFTNPLETAGKPILALTSEKVRTKLLSVWLSSDGGTSSTKLTLNTDYVMNPGQTDVLMINAELLPLPSGQTEYVYYLTLRDTDNVDYVLPIKVTAVAEPDITDANHTLGSNGWEQFNVSTATISGGATSTTSVNGASGYKWYYDVDRFAQNGKTGTFGKEHSIGYIETQDSKTGLFITDSTDATEVEKVRTSNDQISGAVFAIAIKDIYDEDHPDAKTISTVWVDDTNNVSHQLTENGSTGYSYYRYNERLYFPQSLFVPTSGSTTRTTYITVRYHNGSEVCIPIKVDYEDTPTTISDSSVNSWDLFAYNGETLSDGSTNTKAARKARATDDETSNYYFYVSTQISSNAITGSKVMIEEEGVETDKANHIASPIVINSNWMMGAYKNASTSPHDAAGYSDGQTAWNTSKNAFEASDIHTLSFITGKAGNALCTQTKYVWINDGTTTTRYQFDGTNTTTNNQVSYGNDTVHIRESLFTSQMGANEAEHTFTVTIRTDYKDFNFKVKLRRKPNLVISSITRTTNSTHEDGLFYVGDVVDYSVVTANNSLVNITDVNINQETVTAGTNDKADTVMFVDGVYAEAYKNIFAINSLTANSALTDTWNYRYTSAGKTAGLKTFMAKADNGENNGNVDEADETDNTNSTTTMFYPAQTAVTLTNDGTKVTGTWPTPSTEGITPQSAKIVYVDANGDTQTVTLAGPNVTSYDFPVALQNNSTVKVLLSEDANPDENSVWYTHATGTPIADLVITALEPSDGSTDLYPGTAYTLIATVKNIGTADISYNDGYEGNAQVISVNVREGESGAYTYNEWGTSAAGVALAPNATINVTISSASYTPTTSGTHTLNAVVDEPNRVLESIPVANNSFQRVFNVISSGEIEVMGFQMNTNTAEGGVSEFMPSFRTVSRVSRRYVVNNVPYEVEEFGIIYADTANAREINASTMVLENATENGSIRTIRNTVTVEWGGKEDSFIYFPTSFKQLAYNYDAYSQEFSFRAYAKLDNGETVYSDNIPTVSMYEIAQNLYENKKMHTIEQHKFLYDRVLNIKAMHDNSNSIGSAMLKKLGITSSNYTSGEYATLYGYVNTLCIDIQAYTNGYQSIKDYDYAYAHEDENGNLIHECLGNFEPRNLGEENTAALLEALNTASESSWGSIYEWMVNEIPKVKKKNGSSYAGCYTVAPYDWDSYIYKGFTSV